MWGNMRATSLALTLALAVVVSGAVQSLEPKLERPQISVTTDAIGARSAWEQGFDGSGKVIAFIDSGFYRSHEMLATGSSIILEACFSAQGTCPGGLTEIKGQAGAATICTGIICDHGTGTMAASIGYTLPWVANSKNAANTRLGVAPRASAIAIKVGVLTDLPAALNYLADVVNQGLLPAGKQLVAVSTSMGGEADYGDYCYADASAGAIRSLRQLGVITTLGSGNDVANGRTQSPACIKEAITALLHEHGVKTEKQAGVLHAAAMSCPSMPTCGLGLAESERFLPSLLDRIQDLCTEVGLNEEEIIIRMTGCPNGCARPYMAEIGFVGKGPGRYQVWLGGNTTGTRLNRIWKETLKETDTETELRPLLVRYKAERLAGERFGDWVARVFWPEQPTETTAVAA